MSNENRVVLHLTDLHFGCDRGLTEVAARDLALRGMMRAVEELEAEWRPSIACITGDIGWRGQSADYVAARKWLTNLLEALALVPERVFVCVGNHDIDRTISQRYARPKDGPEADRILAVPIASVYRDAFRAFSDFAQALGIAPYELGDQKSYFVGYQSVQGISICAFNSSWFCQGNDDQGKLWIGRPQIDVMEHKGQLGGPSAMDERQPTIALIHHPKEFLHDEEIHARGMRQNTFDALARRCHLILTGHAHGEARRADRYAEAAWHISGGATYAGPDYFNTFSLIRVEEEQIIYRTFEYNPRTADREWRQAIPATALLIRRSAKLARDASASRATLDLHRYRVAAASHAQRVIESKSRALRPRGRLPGIIPLQVRLHVSGGRQRFGTTGDLIAQSNEVQEMAFLQAARASRRTLLLGDLGAGKSTMAARYVTDAAGVVEGGLAIFVPAKALWETPEGARGCRTSKQL